MTVIDGATNNTTTVAVGNDPDAVAVNPNTNKIYVANCGCYGTTAANVTVIDGATNNTTTVAVGSDPNRRGGEPGHEPDLCRELWQRNSVDGD